MDRNKLPHPVRDQRGFTLVELLVVIIVASALMAIAVPSLFSQRSKAGDAEAKEAVRTAALAMETWATDHGGSYTGAGAGALAAVEPVLSGAPLTIVSATGSSYELHVTSDSGNEFSLERRMEGNWRLECVVPGAGGCPPSGRWD